jgi:putative transposase
MSTLVFNLAEMQTLSGNRLTAAVTSPNEALIALAEDTSSPAQSKVRADEHRRELNIEVICAWERFHRAVLEGKSRCGLGAAKAAFIDAYNRREPALDLSAAAFDGRAKISPRTLDRLISTGGAAAKRGRRAGTGKFQSDAKLQAYVEARLLSKPTHTRAIEISFDVENSPQFAARPSRRTIRRLAAAVRKSAAFEAIASPRRFRNVRGAGLGDELARAHSFNARLQLDGTSAEVLVFDRGRLRRFQIIVLVDEFSGLVKILLAEAESSDAFARLLRLWIIDHGLPVLITTDRGSGWKNHRITRALRDLGVAVHFLPAHRPELKGLIESVIKIITHELLERLPGFSGHSPAHAQEIREERSYAAQFGAPAHRVFRVGLDRPGLVQAIADFQEIVNARVNGRTGRVPIQDAISAAPFSRRVDTRAVDVLLGAGKGRLIGRDGIRYGGAIYLPRPEHAAAYGRAIGHQGLILETEDAGRVVVYIEAPERRQFLAVCEDESRLGASRRVIALKAKLAQREFVREASAEARRLIREVRPNAIAAEAFRHAAAQARSMRLQLVETQNIRRVPNFTTPALDAGREAADALDAIGAAAPRARLPRRAAGASDARFARYRSLVCRDVSSLSDDEIMFLRGFESSAAFRARRAAGLI